MFNIASDPTKQEELKKQIAAKEKVLDNALRLVNDINVQRTRKKQSLELPDKISSNKQFITDCQIAIVR